MSRGLGRLQRAILFFIRQHGKPITFGEIKTRILAESGAPPSDKMHPPFERSLRRALHSLVTSKGLIAIGDGGRAEPYRYFIHPLFIGVMGESDEAHALQQALEADPGADAAAARDMAKLFAG
jgi:hypothetical protein